MRTECSWGVPLDKFIGDGKTSGNLKYALHGGIAVKVNRYIKIVPIIVAALLVLPTVAYSELWTNRAADPSQDRRVIGEAQRAEFAGAIERIRTAVAAGEMTEEDGQARITDLEERLARWEQSRDTDRSKEAQRAEFAGAIERIRAAVAAGEMTEEDGQARITDLEERLARWERSRDTAAEQPSSTRSWDPFRGAGWSIFPPALRPSWDPSRGRS